MSTCGSSKGTLFATVHARHTRNIAHERAKRDRKNSGTSAVSIRRAGGVSGRGQTLHGGEGDDEVVHGRVHGCGGETGRRWWRWTEERTEETE